MAGERARGRRGMEMRAGSDALGLLVVLCFLDVGFFPWNYFLGGRALVGPLWYSVIETQFTRAL